MSSANNHIVEDQHLHDLITAIDPSTESGFAPIEKLDAHVKDTPHLAISIFILHEDKLLLQQRALSKYHSGGLWANSVCSHPRWQESASSCAQRRLPEELGWSTALTEFAQLRYSAKVGELYENELVHCFVGTYPNGTSLAQYNPREVMDVRWIRIGDIADAIAQAPDNYSEWFKIYMNRHFDLIAALIK